MPSRCSAGESQSLLLISSKVFFCVYAHQTLNKNQDKFSFSWQFAFTSYSWFAWCYWDMILSSYLVGDSSGIFFEYKLLPQNLECKQKKWFLMDSYCAHSEAWTLIYTLWLERELKQWPLCSQWFPWSTAFEGFRWLYCVASQSLSLTKTY